LKNEHLFDTLHRVLTLAERFPALTAVAASERTLPVHDSLVGLLPSLQRGSTIACNGPAGVSLALALAAAPSQQGAWVGVAGLPELGIRAAVDMGVAVERLVMVTGDPSWVDVLAAMIDGFDVVVVGRRVGRLAGGAVRRLQARAQSRGIVMLTVGMILGYRPDGGPLGVIAGIALLVAFSFAFSWIWTMFGLLLRTEKSVMGVSMMVIFPLTFLSNVFVDPRTMPGWLQAFVNNSPISHLSSAVRGLMAGDWPADEIAWSLGWAGLFIAVFGPITMRLYNRK